MSVLAVDAVGRPVGVAVAAGVERDGVVAGRAERLAGALPGVAGLAATVLEEDERAVRIAPRVAGERHAAGALPAVHRLWCRREGVDLRSCGSLVVAGRSAADATYPAEAT